MNELEQLFYDAYETLENEESPEDVKDYNKYTPMFTLEEQVVVGIYKVDFVCNKCVIEIDGYEFHKTKEQREKDYIRERYLMRQGYTVIRFTGTEVFLNPKKCVMETTEIVNQIAEARIANYLKGHKFGYQDGQRGG